MFLLDSLMIAGIRWALNTTITAAEAEMNDDTALREQLLEAEMRREMGEITDQEFVDIEADLLARIREIKGRREGAGPLAFGAGEPMETSADSRFQVEASVSGDFYAPADAPHTTVVESTADSGSAISVMDMEPGEALAPGAPGLPLTARGNRAEASSRSSRSKGPEDSARAKRPARSKSPAGRKVRATGANAVVTRDTPVRSAKIPAAIATRRAGGAGTTRTARATSTAPTTRTDRTDRPSRTSRANRTTRTK